MCLELNKGEYGKIQEVRLKLSSYTELLHNGITKNYELCNAVAKYRHLKYSILDDNKCFYVRDGKSIISVIGSQAFNDIRYGFVSKKGEHFNSVYRARLVIPIRDIYNRVAGFVGYGKSPKYIISSTFGFSKNIAFGSNYWQRILTYDYVILVEGIFDALQLLSRNYPALAMMGTTIPKTLLGFLNRLKGVVIIGDNDNVGIATSLKWRSMIKNSTIVKIVPCDINVSSQFSSIRHIKDIDDVMFCGGEGAVEICIYKILSDWNKGNYFENYVLKYVNGAFICTS